MEIQWSLVLFTAIAGFGAWLFAFIALDLFEKKAPKANFTVAVYALVAVIVGGICSVFHLGHPEKIFYALGHPGMGIFLEMALIGALIICIIFFMVFYKRNNETAAKIFGVAGALIGIVMSYAMGASYMMAARPAWDTILLPLAYMFTAAGMGAAGYLCLSGAKAEEGFAKIFGLVAMIANLIAAIFVVIFLLSAGANDSAYLWVAVIAFAFAAVFGALTMNGKNVVAFGAGSVICAVLGGITFRCGMWAVGYALMNAFSVL